MSKQCFPWFRSAPPVLVVFCCAALVPAGPARAQEFAEFAPGIAYANHRLPAEPWSIHLVRVERSRPELEIRSNHARNAAIGMSTLSEQIGAMKPEWGTPLAGVNGDFYQRDRAFAGDPRGLQIIDGEVISAPTTGAAFWLDANGVPHTARMDSQFTVTWPDGASFPFGLNEEIGASRSRSTTNVVVLQTPALGRSTRTATNATELVLERHASDPWLPLGAGETFSARVREVRKSGNTPFAPGTMVLSINPFAPNAPRNTEVGAVLKFSTATVPDVRGARMALSAGPVLIHEGKEQDLTQVPKAAGPMAEYSYRSMFERHPRSAVGWNGKYFYLMEVDGRQPGLSMGMKLDEVAGYMARLGCTEVMNLDGGGSAMMFANGRVVNSPCDGGERPIANALIVVKKNGAGKARGGQATQ